MNILVYYSENKISLKCIRIKIITSVEQHIYYIEGKA